MQHWYHNLIKKYTVAVSYIFNDIHVIKYDDQGAPQKDIKVPITYYGKDKMIEYINQKHSDFNTYDQGISQNYDLKIGQIVPRIGFVDGAPQYDASRKKNKTQYYTDGAQQFEIGEPVPYNFPFEVSIYTKRKDDMNQIVEQILTMFTPHLVITVNEIPELGLKSNCPITLDSITYNNSNEHAQEENRVLVTDLTLTLKGYLWPRISESSGIIHYVITNFIDRDTQELYEKLIVDWKTITTLTTNTLVTTSCIYTFTSGTYTLPATVSATYYENWLNNQ